MHYRALHVIGSSKLQVEFVETYGFEFKVPGALTKSSSVFFSRYEFLGVSNRGCGKGESRLNSPPDSILLICTVLEFS